MDQFEETDNISPHANSLDAKLSELTRCKQYQLVRRLYFGNQISEEAFISKVLVNISTDYKQEIVSAVNIKRSRNRLLNTTRDEEDKIYVPPNNITLDEVKDAKLYDVVIEAVEYEDVEDSDFKSKHTVFKGLFYELAQGILTESEFNIAAVNLLGLGNKKFIDNEIERSRAFKRACDRANTRVENLKFGIINREMLNCLDSVSDQEGEDDEC